MARSSPQVVALIDIAKKGLTCLDGVVTHPSPRQGGLMMSFSTHGRLRPQVRFLQRQFLQDGELPFTDVLSERTVEQALKALNVAWLDRIYSPVVTLWVFLGQVLSQDHSCRAAVARLIAHRVSRGQRPCSAETGAYSSRRRPTGSFRTTTEKASAEEIRSNDEAKERAQT